MCWVEPTPTDVKVMRPGSFLAISSSSASVLAGCSARTATTNGKADTVEMNEKSFTGS